MVVGDVGQLSPLLALPQCRGPVAATRAGAGLARMVDDPCRMGGGEYLGAQRGVQNIVITGTFTDCCNLSTAFDAANRDYRVILPRDVAGRAGLDERAEDAALLIIVLYLGLVVDAPALLAEWYARRGLSLPAELEGITDISEVAGEIEVAA